MQTCPEINEKRAYDTEKADMFSLGVIMYLLMHPSPCFDDADYRKDNRFNHLIKNKQLIHYLDEEKVSQEFKECLLGLLAYNEHERTSLSELNDNPWLNNFTNGN